MKYISTLLVALSLTATAAHAGTSMEVGSGSAVSEDFYSLRIKNSVPVGGGFNVIPELRLDSGKDSGKTSGNAKLGVYHDVLKAGPAIVGTRISFIQGFGTAGRSNGWHMFVFTPACSVNVWVIGKMCTVPVVLTNKDANPNPAIPINLAQCFYTDPSLTVEQLVKADQEVYYFRHCSSGDA